jgi:hypothetical protein
LNSKDLNSTNGKTYQIDMTNTHLLSYHVLWQSTSCIFPPTSVFVFRPVSVHRTCLQRSVREGACSVMTASTCCELHRLPTWPRDSSLQYIRDLIQQRRLSTQSLWTCALLHFFYLTSSTDTIHSQARTRRQCHQFRGSWWTSPVCAHSKACLSKTDYITLRQSEKHQLSLHNHNHTMGYVTLYGPRQHPEYWLRPWCRRCNPHW